MKVLHTSDWHLGTEMEGHKRTVETEALLQHIIHVVKREGIHTLLVTGDVFDTHSPSNQATKQYYDFLVNLKKSTAIENVVIIAGNHDSPTYLDAPSGLLETMGIHVIGNICQDNLAHEVIPLKEDGQITAVACAVPYLVSPGLPGKCQEEQDAAYEKYIVEHYKNVVAIAKENHPGKPIIALGHFFAIGGRGSDDKVLRGTLHSIHVDALPLDDICYLALGHLHRSQTVNGLDKVRYPGSLHKMSFVECDKDKEFILWDSATPQEFRSLPLTREEVPQICRMVRLAGTVEELEAKLIELKIAQRALQEDVPLWLSLENTGAFYSELKNHLTVLLGDNSGLEIIGCLNKALNPALINIVKRKQPLKNITPGELFADFLGPSTICKNC